MAVGRNDPCPCGSGKKYKKCCFKKDRVEERVSAKRRDVDEVLPPDSSIYRVWREWRRGREEADFNFLYDIIETDSPLAGRFDDREHFVATCSEGGEGVIPSGGATFKHLVITDSTRARLLQVSGEHESSREVLVCECIHLNKTEKGWRFSQFERMVVPKVSAPTLSVGLFEPEEAEPEEAESGEGQVG